MQTSISDPYPLATYSLKSPGAPTNNPSVFASHCEVPGSPEGWITVTAQGDGVHIFDLASSQPIASHTLGPSIFFSAPSVTTISSSSGNSIRRTYAAVISESSEGGSQDIWIWTDDASQPFASSLSKKRESKIMHRVCKILPSPIADQLITVAPSGTVTSVGPDLQSISSISEPHSYSEDHVLSWMFAGKDCAFMAPGEAAAILVRLVHRNGKGSALRIDYCDAQGQLTEGSSLFLTSDLVVDAALASSGELCCLLPSGKWSYFQIAFDSSISGGGLHLLTLHSLPALCQTAAAALLQMTPSHVLLASTSTSPLSSSIATPADTISKQLALTLKIWDLQYDSPLASFSAKLPSTSSSAATSETLSHHLIYATSTHAILILSPAPTPSPSPSSIPDKKPGKTKSGSKSAISSTKEPQSGRSHVLIVPVNVPRKSTLAAALLSRAALRQSVVPSHGISLNGRIINTIRDALNEKDPARAVESFWAWIHAQGAILEDSGTIKKKKSKPGGEEAIVLSRRAKVPLPHSFVAQIISAISEAEPEAWMTVRPILEFLLRRRVLTNGMLRSEGGLVRLFADRGDWALVKSSMQELSDIPEEEVIQLLRVITEATLKNSHHEGGSVPHNSHKKERMQIDEPSTDLKSPKPTSQTNQPLPQLPVFLVSTICYPLAGGPLRTALRQHFGTDARHTMIILERLERWVEKWSLKVDWQDVKPYKRVDATGLKLPESAKGKVFSVARPESHDNEVMPSLEDIVLFLEALMDASFLTLLTHAPAQAVLSKLSANIKPALELSASLEQLRGPLEPFVRVRRIAKSSGLAVETAVARQQLTVAARNARDNSAVVGLYQIEELVL